jgi:CubicO group peptidase (beta-lactamase class C family)
MALVDEGLIGLDEPVDRLLPELADRRVLTRPDGPLDETIPAERPITTRDLLTFTFGFGMAFEMFTSPTPWPVREATRELGLATLAEPNPAVQPDPDTWIANLGTLPLIAQPGQRWLYNTGASVLGVLVSRAAQEPFADVLRKRIFEPLGMRDTAFWTSQTDRLATAYAPRPEGLALWDEPDGRWSRPPAFGDGAGGLISTVDDLLAFARMFLRGGAPVLSAYSVRAMSTDQLTETQKARGGLVPGFFDHMSWGFCQAVYDTGAFGWDGGLGTSWRVDPARDLTVIVLTQRLWERAELPQVHRDIQAAAYAALR